MTVGSSSKTFHHWKNCLLRVLRGISILSIHSTRWSKRVTEQNCYPIMKRKLNNSVLPTNVTPKVHAVFHHVGEFCGMVNKGLGPWSEQAAESLHSDFTKMWQNYKLRDTDHDQYGERLLDAIITYNSQHM